VCASFISSAGFCSSGVVAQACNFPLHLTLYKPREDIVELIKNNPNVVDAATKSLYNNLASQYRGKQINGRH